jgi:hypothetical protein
MKGRNSLVVETLIMALILGLVFVGCDNDEINKTTNNGYSVSVTIIGLPTQYVGLECEIEVNPSPSTFFSLTIYNGKVSGSTITVDYNLTKEDITSMENYGIPYNANGNYWIEFDIEEYPDDEDFVTRNSVKFSSGKAAVNFSDFVVDD